MPDLIKEIPSDSQIQKFEMLGASARFIFLLDVYEQGRNTKSLVLDDVYALNLLSGWRSDIEAVTVATQSVFLEHTRTLMQEDGDSPNLLSALRSYQLIGSSSGEPVAEIIAKDHRIE